MTTSAAYDRHLDQIASGEPLAAETLEALAGSHDILTTGMLADALRRRLHGTTTTFLRVAAWPVGNGVEVPPAAREVRVTGVPADLEAAVRALSSARVAAAGRPVAGFSWAVIEGLATTSGRPVAEVLGVLREAGLEALAGVPLDTTPDLDAAVRTLVSAGFHQLRLMVASPPGGSALALFLRAAALQATYGVVQALNPLPVGRHGGEPTTGYEDVRTVALARLAAPAIPTIQVDWLRYGPKLAQVALTVGADDLDGVDASDDAPEGRRRAPLEEVRRNIVAAGFEPRERDSRFAAVA